MCESILYKVDLVGASPKLLIFKNQRYKSILSSLISLLIIIISIIFIIYTLIEYFKYQSPIVVYSKDNDQETNRTIYLKDSLLIFQLVDTSNFLHINNSIAYYEAEYTIQLDDGTYVSIPLIIENCEIGKNIDIKYKDYILRVNINLIEKLLIFIVLILVEGTFLYFIFLMLDLVLLRFIL